MNTEMSLEEIHASYSDRFGNLGDVAPPQLIHDPKVADLMAVALARGTPLSRDEVLQAFPDEDFESCHP